MEGVGGGLPLLFTHTHVHITVDGLHYGLNVLRLELGIGSFQLQAKGIQVHIVQPIYSHYIM